MIADVHAVPLLMGILATYRVAHMLTTEEGPFELLTRWRALFDRFAGSRRTHWVVNGVNCTLCVSFWLSLLTAMFYGWLYALPAHVVILLWWAIAGAVAVVHKVAR